MVVLIIIVIWLLFCGGISYIGKRRRIGSFYSFFISATISPLVGLIFTLNSPSLKSENAYKPNNSFRRFCGIVSYCISIFIIILAIFRYFSSYNQYEVNYWTLILLFFGFYVIGEYLYNYPIPKEDELVIEMPHTDLSKVKSQWDFKRNEPISIKYFKIPVILIASFFVLFVITNPKSKDFKEFRGLKEDTQLRRLSNWGVFSFYLDRENNEKFVGFFMNFYKIED